VSLAAAVGAASGREVRALQRVGGGDINDAFRVQFEDESFAFVKTRANVAPGEYAAEAAGLRWLAEPGALRVPEVLGVADDVLVLDWVDEGGRGDDPAFGAGLAEVHAAGGEAFGATPPAGAQRRGGEPGGPAAIAGATGSPPPLRLASLSLPNDPAPDWPTFYAERRLLPLLEHAGLTRFGNRAVENVCARMSELAGPPEPPSRLHGDLWSGNVLWGRDGKAWLIDPAAYGGHREVDLAMLRLFGSPGRQFLAAYEARFPLAPGHEERVELYQLFPLLVHAALFGGGYVASAERVARTYA
jgi:fructosamine-3-kinase